MRFFWQKRWCVFARFEIMQARFPANSAEVWMGPKTPIAQSGDLFRQLREQINLKHPIVQLGEQINWQRIEAVCASSFTSGRGRPATSPRLIAGLLYLQHAFDLSDEQVVWGWVENPYWQVFTGETYLQTEPPIDPSSLTRWRQRLGEAGIEELLAATVAAARWRAVAHGQPQDGDCGHDGRAQGSGASDGLALARTQSPALGQGCCRARLEAAAEQNREAPALAAQIGRLVIGSRP